MTSEIRELSLNELASVSGGTDSLHLLATVSHAQADNASDAMFGALAGALGGTGGAKGKARRTA